MKKYLGIFVLMFVLLLIPSQVQALTYVSDFVELEDTVVFDTQDFRISYMFQTFNSHYVNQVNEDRAEIYGYCNKKSEDVKNVYYQRYDFYDEHQEPIGGSIGYVYMNHLLKERGEGSYHNAILDNSIMFDGYKIEDIRYYKLSLKEKDVDVINWVSIYEMSVTEDEEKSIINDPEKVQMDLVDRIDKEYLVNNGITSLEDYYKNTYGVENDYVDNAVYDDYEDDPLHGDYPLDNTTTYDKANEYVIHSKSSSGTDVYSLDFDDFNFDDYLTNFEWTPKGLIIIACCIGITILMWLRGTGISIMGTDNDKTEGDKQVFSFFSIVAIWLLISIPMSIDTKTVEMLPMILIFVAIGMTVFIGSLVGAFKSMPRIFGLIWGGGFGGIPMIFAMPAILSSPIYGLAFIIGLICIGVIMVKIRIQNSK